MKTKITVNEAMIEMTRRCNMCCDHCMRGEAENVDIDIKYIEKFFDQISCIDTLTLTGGEPSLVPHIIMEVIRIAKEKNTHIGHFYMVTNAKEVTDDFLRAIFELHMFCDDDEEIGGLSISNDAFHDELDKENVKKLMAFRFASKRNDGKNQYDNNYDGGRTLLWEGRAALNFACTKTNEPREYVIEENYIQDVELYLNAEGKIVSCCDLSYDSQDDEESLFTVADVKEKDFNLLERIKKYNEKLMVTA